MASMERMDSVELLRRQYLQCLDPESLTLPKPELLRLPEIQSRIYSSMFDESKLDYTPPERYRFRVLKGIIAALEKAIEDPEEDVCHYSRHTISLCQNFRSVEFDVFTKVIVCRYLSKD